MVPFYSAPLVSFYSALDKRRKNKHSTIRLIAHEAITIANGVTDAGLGCRISKPDTAPNTNIFLPYKAPAAEKDRELIDDAVETAKNADVVILVLGGNENVSREATSNELMGTLTLSSCPAVRTRW